MERILLKNNWSIDKMTECLESETSSDRAGHRWKRGNGALSRWNMVVGCNCLYGTTTTISGPANAS